MKYTVRLLAKAAADADHIYSWLEHRSPQGAAAWREALHGALDDLSVQPQQFGYAPDSKLGREFRQRLFRTRRGQRYRLIYMIEASDVYVFRIRGPGQPPLRRNDL